MGYVVERAEGARRKQRIARTPEHAGMLVMRFREPLDNRCLPNSRLAAHKDKAAIACGDLAEYGLQFIEHCSRSSSSIGFSFRAVGCETKVKAQGCECKITGVPGCASDFPRCLLFLTLCTVLMFLRMIVESRHFSFSWERPALGINEVM